MGLREHHFLVGLVVACALGCDSESAARGNADGAVSASDVDGGGAGDTYCLKGPLWTETGTRIKYEVRGPVGQLLCSESVERAQLTEEELAGLSDLTFVGESCGRSDTCTYKTEVGDSDGSSAKHEIGPWHMLYEALDAWAGTRGCSCSLWVSGAIGRNRGHRYTKF